MPCALPPLDQSEVLIGRGFGRGYNRERTARDQLHAGMDFVASSGAPVLAPFPGVVDFVTRDTGPRINVATARAGEQGQVRGMGGYGNAVVLRHDTPVPGLPSPFYSSYNHLSAIGPGIVPGASVQTGQLLGNVGQTTNGQFRGMGAHLHMEVRRVEFPGNYNRDTVDPSVLFTANGIDWIGGRTEVERRVGGQLMIRADGPSGPAACPRTATGLAALPIAPLLLTVHTAALLTPKKVVHEHRLAGQRSSFPWWAVGVPGVPFMGLGTVQEPPPGYVNPLSLKPTYARKGTTQMPREGSPAADVMPPDYATIVNDVAPAANSGTYASGDNSMLIGAGVAAAIVVAGMMKGRR